MSATADRAPHLAIPSPGGPGQAALPPTAALLTHGGDARIVLDPSRGLNKYGCSPFPDARLAAFGSSTASTISA